MIIQCPFCRAESRIPSDKEGAKVRCGECSKVYTARPPGARRSTSTSGITIGIFVGAGVLIAIGFLIINRYKPPSVVPEVQAVEEVDDAPLVDSVGWDSELVRTVRDVYQGAFDQDRNRLRPLLHLEQIHFDSGATADFTTLTTAQIESLFDGTMHQLVEGLDGEDDDVVAEWKPFDGEVVEEEDTRAVVRVKVQGRDGERAIESRTMEFQLARDIRAGDRWKVVSWQRWFSPEELAAMKRRRAREYEKVTLSDGSVVYEADPRPLEHLDDTPMELRAEIDAAFARMIDFELRPPENAAAKRELEAIGRPAIPILLTGLYEIPLETDEQAMKVNLINQCLEEITGFYTGWKPQVAQGSGTGTTEERRQSAIKQWFAWWFRKGHRFEEKSEGGDLLDELITPTERDLRDMERNKASQGG
jgi:predicted Zn finger-like uncharacterized protein